MFSSVSESGLEIFTDYGKLLLLLVGCMCCTAFVVNPFIAWLHIRKNPYPLYWKCLKESGLNAFFTRSSAANIPINMDLCKRLGLDEEFYSVSIPLGSTVNMNGAAVTITVLSLAVAHTVGVEVSFASALFLSLIATLGACGASGVAGGSLLLVPMACSFFGPSRPPSTPPPTPSSPPSPNITTGGKTKTGGKSTAGSGIKAAVYRPPPPKPPPEKPPPPPKEVWPPVPLMLPA